jgi:hypothetical protein
VADLARNMGMGVFKVLVGSGEFLGGREGQDEISVTSVKRGLHS